MVMVKLSEVIDEAHEMSKGLALGAIKRLIVSLTPEELAKMMMIMPRFIQGGLHQDDFQWAVDNALPGYTLTKFELSIDGYHWDATWTSLAQLEKEGRLV